MTVLLSDEGRRKVSKVTTITAGGWEFGPFATEENLAQFIAEELGQNWSLISKHQRTEVRGYEGWFGTLIPGRFGEITTSTTSSCSTTTTLPHLPKRLSLARRIAKWVLYRGYWR